MKIKELTELLRKVVREEVKTAFKEDLKEIILESVKSNRENFKIVPLQEGLNSNSTSFNPIPSPNGPEMNKLEMREAYKNVINETANFNTSQFHGEFQPKGTPIDNENGTLPPGEVSLDTILNLGKV